MKLKEILEKKGDNVISISDSDSILKTIKLMKEHNIGAVLVLNNKKKLVGIITERDVLNECGNTNGAIENVKVQDIMTKDIIIGVPDDEVDYLMGVMTKNKIRHMPILKGEKVVGVISIRDLVDSQLEAVEFENKMLKDYMGPGYY